MITPKSVKQYLQHCVRSSKSDAQWFFKNVLAVDTTQWDQWQYDLAEAVLDIERHLRGAPTKVNHRGLNKITIRAPHGPGKTYAVAAVMHLFQFVYNARIVATAPKEEQLKSRLWPEFRKLHASAPEWYRRMVRVDATKITFFGDKDRAALAETASDPTNLAGHHRDFLLFIVDEASGVKENMFPVIEGALSTGKVVVVILIGNPVKNTGTFFDSHMRKRVAQNWFRVHVSLDKTRRVSPQWVEEMRNKYGENSPVFQTRCLGNFAETGENQLVQLSWLHDMLNREVNVQGDGSLGKLRISVDVSDGGADETVITAAREYQSYTVLLYQGAHSFEGGRAITLCCNETERVFDELGGVKNGVDDIVVDSLGVGAGVCSTLLDRGYRVVRYIGGASSDRPKLWRNRRVQSYLAFRDALRDGRLQCVEDFAGTEWDDFTAQVCSVLKKETIRLEDLETKEEMKRRGAKSPDRADSVAMQFATQAPMMGASDSGEPVAQAFPNTFTETYDGSLA